MLKWKRILVATDFSERADVAVRTAERLAENADGTVWAVHVVDLIPPYLEHVSDRVGPADAEEMWLRKTRQRMENLLEEIRRRVPDGRGFVRTGLPWRRVVDLAEEGDVDGICIGVSGHSRIERLLLGSTAENVIRHATVPVLVTRDEPLEAVHEVLLPTEMDEGSSASIRYALERFDPPPRLEAIHVVPIHPMVGPEVFGELPTRGDYEEVLREFLEGFEGGDRVAVRVVPFADPAATIVEVSRKEKPDLIVMATHARRGLSRALLGSVSEKVVRHADAPILVMPGPRTAEAERTGEPLGRWEGPLEGEVAPLAP